MHTDEVFLGAIAEQPHDNLHRAVHADWLDDRGQAARAELIRAQCELERLPPASDRALALRRRVEDLLAEHEAEWLGEWADRLVRWEWRGGYPHSATIEADTWERFGVELMRAIPLYRLAFVDREGAPIPPEAIEGVVRSPAFARVRGLDTECGGNGSMYSNPPRRWVCREWLSQLAALPGPTWLEELNLADSGRGGERFPEDELAGAPALAGLRSLRLEGAVGFSDTGVRALARAPFSRSLASLDLGYTGVVNAGVLILATEPAFAGLRRLNLAGCATGVEALRAILTSSVLQQLDSLEMVFEEDLDLLARCPRLGQFTELAFAMPDHDAPAPEDAWLRLARALGEAGSELRSLRVESSQLSADALQALLCSPGLAGLWSLRLFGLYNARPFDWSAVLNPGWPLYDLELESCQLVGLDAFAGWPGLARLRSLRLRGLRDAGNPDAQLEALLASSYFGDNLERLDFGCTEDDEDISFETLLQLAGSPRLVALRDLTLDWQSVPAAFIETLAASPVARHLTRLQLTGHAQSRVEAEGLADPNLLPRLRELSISRMPEVTHPEGLRGRFGPRLRLWHP